MIMKQLSTSELNSLSKEDLAAIVLQQQQMINSLVEKVAILDMRSYGRSTEKLSAMPGQINFFNEADAEADESAEEPTIEDIVVRKKKKKGQRKDDLSKLPVRIETHELTEQQLAEIYGENGWKRLPDEVYPRVEHKPSVKEVVEHHVAVYAGKKIDKIVKAPRPADLLRNSVATPSLVAAIMNAKYTNAVPLYRISQEYARCDLNLSRATMSNWVIRCSERYLSLVYDRLLEHLCQQKVLQVDETPCQVTKDGRARKEGRGSTAKSYMFVYRTSELSTTSPVILYKYEKTRSPRHVVEFLKGFSGILESDAFSGYKSLDKNEENIQAAFCWVHARRDFATARKVMKGLEQKPPVGSTADIALKLIASIYKAENGLKKLSAEERQISRQKEVMPLVEAYFAWVRQQDIASISSEKTRQALQYSLNQEKFLKVFLENGEVPIDNSATERSIRPFAVGRSNWHIIDTVHGAQASAIIYSLVETAKANDLRIYEYLEHLLTEIPKHMDDKDLGFIEDLLPWSEALPQRCHKSK